MNTLFYLGTVLIAIGGFLLWMIGAQAKNKVLLITGIVVVIIAFIIIILGTLYVFDDAFAPIKTYKSRPTGIMRVDRPVDYIAPWALNLGTRFPGDVG